MSSPFDATLGVYKLPQQFYRLREAYFYGSWDEAAHKANYAFNHEPLMVTFQQLEEEVIKLSYVPLEVDGENEDAFCDPVLSISKYVIEKKLVALRESLVPYAVGADDADPNAGGAKQAKANTGVKASDQAYKGQFQRIKGDSDKDDRYWSKETHRSHFSTLFKSFRKHVVDRTLANEPDLVWAPLKKLGEASKAAGFLPDGFDAFMSEYCKVRTRPAASQPQSKLARAAGGGRRRAVDALDEHGETPNGPAYAIGWEALGGASGIEEFYDEGQGPQKQFEKAISKKQFEAFQKTASSAISALQSAQKTTQEKLEDLLTKDNDDPDSAEKWQLLEYDQQMRAIMGQLGSVVAILTSSMQPTDPMLKAAHCVMDSIVSLMENTYKWDSERKRVILESMKHQEPFKVALAALKS